MSTPNLSHALRAALNRVGEPIPRGHRLRTPQCPSLPRLAAALGGGWTPAERAHVAGCGYCRKLLSLHRRLSRPAADTPRIRAAGPVRAGAAHALAAMSGGPFGLIAVSPDRRLEAELAVEGGRLALEVRTHDAALNHRPVEYRFAAAGGAAVETGYLVLRPDQNGWFAAQAEFPADVSAGLDGTTLTVQVLAADGAGIDPGLLRAAVARDRDDGAARAAWRAWADGAARLPDDLRAAVREPGGGSGKAGADGSPA